MERCIDFHIHVLIFLMGKAILNTIKIPVILFKLLGDLRFQRSFMRDNIADILEQYSSSNDGSLKEKDFIKINRYYGIAVPAIMGEAFCALRGTKMTKNERLVSTCQGAITGLFDDFFDDLKMPHKDIQEIITNPESVVAQSSNVSLFLSFYLLALKHASHPNWIKEQFMLVHKAQISSVEQENLNISKKRIVDITKQKGGDSVLFYRTAFDNFYAEGEKEALYHLGFLLQYENDIFDVYKDTVSGIYTYPTTCTKVSNLRKLYIGEMENVIDLVKKMDYPHRQKRAFLDRLMPVIVRGFVCLDNYKKLENTNNGRFIVESFSRKQLICDMEKISNILKTIKYQIINYY